MEKFSRRGFLSQSTLVWAGAFAAISIPDIVRAALSTSGSSAQRLNLRKDSLILFQGDSITDYSRDRSVDEANSADALGHGYPAQAGAHILLRHTYATPRIYNRAVGGDTVTQLQGRWEADTLALQPDILSVLIGVNDFRQMIGKVGGVTPESYRRNYMALMHQTRERLPDAQIVIGEPFAMKGVRIVTDEWYPRFDEIRAAAREVAQSCGSIFVPYQQVFDEAMHTTPATYWTHDGIHANLVASLLMAEAWLQATGLAEMH